MVKRSKPHGVREKKMPMGVDMPASQIGAAGAGDDEGDGDDDTSGGAFANGGRIKRGTATQREKLFKHRKNRSGC